MRTRQATDGIDPQSTGEDMSPDPRIERLPHQPPFRFVSRLKLMEPGHVVACWDVTAEEWFLPGHFPGRPLVPGVLITEALAQACGLAADDSDEPSGGMLVSSDMRFRRPVTPPATIELEANLVRSMPPLHLFEASATVDGERCAEGTIGLLIGDAPEDGT